MQEETIQNGLNRNSDFAAGKTPKSPGIKIMPPTVFYCCLLLGIGLEWLLPTSFSMTAAWRLGLGVALGGAGFTFMMYGHERFKRLGTNVRTNLPAKRLVRGGAYRYSRNPMYVGGSALYLGLALCANSLWMAASWLPLGGFLALYVVPKEETYMLARFGEAYAAYCDAVRRWL